MNTNTLKSTGYHCRRDDLPTWITPGPDYDYAPREPRAGLFEIVCNIIGTAAFFAALALMSYILLHMEVST